MVGTTAGHIGVERSEPNEQAAAKLAQYADARGNPFALAAWDGTRVTGAQPIAGGPRIVSTLAGDSRFHAIVGEFVQRLRQAIAEVDLARQKGDYVELARFAHWLAGSGGSMGFDVLTQSARQLEHLVKARDSNRIEMAISDLKALASRVAAPGETVGQPPGH